MRACVPELIVGPPLALLLRCLSDIDILYIRGTGVRTCQEQLRSSATDTKSVHISSVVPSCQTRRKKKKRKREEKKEPFCVQEKQK